MTKQTTPPATAGKIDESKASSQSTSTDQTRDEETGTESSSEEKPKSKPGPKAADKPTKTVFSVRREEKKSQVLEFKTVKKSGALFVMQQKGVTIIEDGKTREIRYCPDEPSVYRDNQDRESRRAPIMFVEGRLFVRPDQPNLAEYLSLHPGNKANGGNTFYLVDEAKEKNIDLNKEYLVVDAISMIRTKQLDELLAVATALNINIDRNVDEIKHDLLVFAKKNPQSFIDSFDNPIVEMKAKLRQANKYQIIKLSDDGVRWFDTGKLILSVPAGKDPLDVMMRWCLTETAAPVVAEIEKQLRR
jgi:hypothetical protein